MNIFYFTRLLCEEQKIIAIYMNIVIYIYISEVEASTHWLIEREEVALETRLALFSQGSINARILQKLLYPQRRRFSRIPLSVLIDKSSTWGMQATYTALEKWILSLFLYSIYSILSIYLRDYSKMVSFVLLFTLATTTIEFLRTTVSLKIFTYAINPF